MEQHERYRGALLGLAAGDALGTTLEFKPPGSFTPIEDIVGGGPFGLQPGQWTDDTSMALCLAESLIERQGFDADHQMQTYCRWWREGHWSCKSYCFDIGITTSGALRRYQATGNPFSGSTDEHSAGNGSLMRLAPVPLAFATNLREAIAKAGDSSRTTHGAAECVDACRFYAGMIVGALTGASKDELLAANYSPVPGLWDEAPLAPKIAAIVAGSYKHRDPPEIRGSGYVVESLEAALWAFHRTEDFRSGALLAVNLGDDADTTGAVYGQIAGTYYGESGIPAEWRAKIAMHEKIEELAGRLLDLARKPLAT
jgi:ADP-ribosylglycohydrolase